MQPLVTPGNWPAILLLLKRKEEFSAVLSGTPPRVANLLKGWQPCEGKMPLILVITFLCRH